MSTTAAVVTQDERLKRASLLVRAMRRPELGAVAGLILVIVFFGVYADKSMFTLGGVMTVHGAGVGTRHPRGRRGAADDRRRVRPLHRLDGGAGRADPGREPLRAAPAVRGRVPSDGGVRGGAGGGERHHRDPHQAAELHRHAGLPVHLSRPVAGGAEMGDRRIDAIARDRRCRGRRAAPRPVLGPRVPSGVRLDGRARHDPEIPLRRADGAGRAGVDPVVRRLRAAGDLGAAGDPRRQLDLRRRRRCQCRAQFRRAGGAGQDGAVHADRGLGRAGRGACR